MGHMNGSFSPLSLRAALLRQIGAFSFQGLQGKHGGEPNGSHRGLPSLSREGKDAGVSNDVGADAGSGAALCARAATWRGRDYSPVSLHSASPPSIYSLSLVPVKT